MSMLFKALAEFAEKQALDSSNIGLFGEPEPVSVKDAIQYAQQVLGDDFISVQMYDSLFSNACNYLKLIDYVFKDPLFVIKSLIINIKKYKF